jgi:hypothetical protein
MSAVDTATRHVGTCSFHETNIEGATGALLLFGGTIKCSCPPAHTRAERKRVRAARAEI